MKICTVGQFREGHVWSRSTFVCSSIFWLELPVTIKLLNYGLIWMDGLDDNDVDGANMLLIAKRDNDYECWSNDAIVGFVQGSWCHEVDCWWRW